MSEYKTREFKQGYADYFNNSKPNPYDSWHEPDEYRDWLEGQKQAEQDAILDDDY
jgi:hypothetical protein